MDKHVAPLRTHYPDTEPTWPLLLNLKCCALRGEVVNTYFIVFDLTQLFYDYSNTSLFDEQVLLTTTPVLAIVINSKTQKEEHYSNAVSDLTFIIYTSLQTIWTCGF